MSDPISRLNAALEGRYHVERELGEGGMATVYLAEDLRHERQVALKVVRPELAAAVGADRFLAEIKTTAHMQHPHILPLFDSGEADGFLYYVMPYVDGESLRERLDREYQLPVDDALRIATDVAEALDYAHRHGVIHRDIKPSNILLQDGRPVVADFGIALAVGREERTRMTRTGRSVGTPQYMSPEQATGEREVDARTDVYALGCVLYEMLAGEPPWTASTPEAVLSKKLVTAPPSVRVLRDTVPWGLDAAIMRALSKAAADRPRSADEFARALKEGSTQSGELQAVAGTRLRRRPMVVAVVVAVALILGGGWWTFGRPGPSGPSISSLLVLPPENLSDDPEQELLLSSMHDALIGQLHRVSELRTLSRTSAEWAADSELSLREMGSELEVDAVLEWSAEMVADVLRGRWSLIQVPDERTLASNAYERPVREVLAFYDDVARAIAAASAVELTPADETRLAEAREVDPEVYQLVARAAYYNDLLVDEAYPRALALVDSALSIDSLYAPAYAERAATYIRLGSWLSARPLPSREVIPRIRAAVDRALAIDSTDSRALASLGTLRFWFEWDFEGAEQVYERGMELRPSGDLAYMLGFVHAVRGDQEEAIAMARRSVELDPASYIAWANLAFWLEEAGRWEDARVARNESRWLGPNVDGNPFEVSDEPAPPPRYYIERGEYELAVSVMETTVRANHWDDLGQLALLYGLAGRETQAREVLSTLLERRAEEYMPASAIARAYVGLDQRDEAIDWLYTAFREGDMALIWLKEGWEYASLRGEPRYEELVRLIFPD